ncbi:MaoC family dehydratase [Nocardioides pantholopis]|uniref:MaoC family dehydratase n=1 Tax=Nocardioides pantholopis TaxID=2483798 RepID=UPI000FD98F13|nr:MaoC family dehydratase [Nocardioides pantholopis]
MTTRVAEGPWFDELEVGQVFDQAPAMTLAEGRAAAHQAILGDRLRLPLDDALARAVTGAPLAHPAYVWNVAIGQSTLATQHVKANLFYRDLALLRQPAIGDTLRTVTSVVGLRENSRREGRAPTGLAALHMRTEDQRGRAVLDFYRCAMLPLRGQAATGHADDLGAIGSGGSGGSGDVGGSVADWDLGPLRQAYGDPGAPQEGEVVVVHGGDVVTSAPELARLTLNIAAVHHDERAGGGRRLVYGGHTIGLALAQVARALPGLVTVLAWEGCNHTGPVYEGDTLRSRITVGAVRGGPVGRLVDLRVETAADDDRGVLDWRFTALF